jgi:hypothetical protein
MVGVRSKVSSNKVSSKGAEDTTASPDQSSGGRELQVMVGVSSKVSSRGAQDTTASPDQSSYETASPDQSYPLHLQISRMLCASDWSGGREL